MLAVLSQLIRGQVFHYAFSDKMRYYLLNLHITKSYKITQNYQQ
jgi:hypothetical protein